MNSFSSILTNLQTVIAAKAARERALTVLLVALWGRIARMRARLERLIARWRAGKLPKPRAPRVGVTRVCAPRGAAKITFPTAIGWLPRMLGYQAAALGPQLAHLLTEAEWQEFLAAAPQAGRIFRPLFRMLTADPVPEVVRRVMRVVPEAVPVAELVGVVVGPAIQFSRA